MLRLSGEGRVVGLLELHGSHHAQRAVEASVVDQSAGDGVLDVGDRSVGAIVEDRGADAFGLLETVDVAGQIEDR